MPLSDALTTSLIPYGPNHGTAELSSLVESGSAVAGTCDTLVIHDSNSLPQASQQVTSDIITHDVTHDCDFFFFFFCLKIYNIVLDHSL